MEHARPWPGEGDPYDLLGVAGDASQQEIVRAYHRAAQRVHPDTQPGDPQAQARFHALAEAYELLRNPERRAEYDLSQRRAARPGRPAASQRRRGPWPGGTIWAGPVHVRPPGEAADPPDAAVPRDPEDAAFRRDPEQAVHQDPAVFLGLDVRLLGGRVRWRWSWPW